MTAATSHAAPAPDDATESAKQESDARPDDTEDVRLAGAPVVSMRALAAEAGLGDVERSDTGCETGCSAQPAGQVQLALGLLSFAQGAGTALLPAAVYVLKKDLGMHLEDLAWLGVAQTASTNAAGPLFGALVDLGAMRSRNILVACCAGHGLVTASLALALPMPPMWAMFLLHVLNGVLLAPLRPVSNCIVGYDTAPAERGTVFGRVQSSLLLGMLVCSMATGAISRISVFGLEGWRIAFVLVGIVAVVVSARAAALLGELAPGTARHACTCSRSVFFPLASDVGSVCATPTFCLSILQGALGAIAWSAMGNLPLFFQMAGISDALSTALCCSLGVAGVFGTLLGGLYADIFAARFPCHGRPAAAQLSVALGLLTMCLLFLVVSRGEWIFWAYLAFTAWFGFLGTWSQAGAIFPILCEIAPTSCRASVLALEGALENSLALVLGPPAVAFLAAQCAGYSFGDQATKDAEAAVNSVSTLGGPTFMVFGAATGATDVAASLESAVALGKAMAAVFCIPWGLSFIACSLLHWSYARDVYSSEARPQAGGADQAELACIIRSEGSSG